MCPIEFNFFHSKLNLKHGVKTLQAVKTLAFSIGMDVVLLKGSPNIFFNNLKQESLSFSCE